jgi:uncharacterized membrane protein YqjE
MESSSLLLISISAFIAVFALLSILALVMKIIIMLFPQPEVKTDASVVAALAVTLSSVYPGTKITNIEEI